MRQGQQNRRGRGRNRKSHNPLSRSFESNGPDVKIRGTPAHIAEKYLSLARDAQSSGDPVLAENYLQHAEHYSRIIMAYRDQLQQPGDANGNGQRLQGEADDFGDDEGDDLLDDGFQPMLHSQPSPPQGRPYEGNRHDNNRVEGGHSSTNNRYRAAPEFGAGRCGYEGFGAGYAEHGCSSRRGGLETAAGDCAMVIAIP